MKKKVKSILLVLFSVVASLFLFAGCELGETLEEALASRNLTVSVTYYANGGQFTSNSQDVCKLYYEADNLPLNIGAGGSREDYESGGAAFSGPITAENAVNRKYYEFLGWYHAQKDENGAYLKEEIKSDDGKTVKSVIYYATEELVDFKQTLPKGDYVFVAKWREIPKFVVQLVCDTPDVEMSVKGICDEMKEKTSLKHGDTVRTFRFDENGKTDSIDISAAPFTADGYTLINYYYDEACTQPLSGTITRGEMNEDKTVYLRVATGVWTVVKNANDFNKVNWGKADARYWIANDINASSLASKVPPSTVACEVQGNGFTISGMTYKRAGIGKTDKVSLFGEIQATAKIENLTFADLKITYEIKIVPNENDGGSIYTVFTSLSESATITNVRLTGTMSISKASTAGDLDKSAIRCFGGYATDEDYTDENGFVSEIVIK